VKTNLNRKNQIFTSSWNCRQFSKRIAPPEQNFPSNSESSDNTCWNPSNRE